MSTSIELTAGSFTNIHDLVENMKNVQFRCKRKITERVTNCAARDLDLSVLKVIVYYRNVGIFVKVIVNNFSRN